MTVSQHTLYVVATPIGNRDDFSQRAISTLTACDRIYAEDTRHSRPLLQHHGISTPLYSLHEHNEQARISEITGHLQQVGPVAIISDAGTPLISDPGYRIVRACQESGLRVSPIPGASALTAAMCVAGLPTDRVLFAGFTPAKRVNRIQWLSEHAHANYTLVIYESPHRVLASLADIVQVFGATREITLARELTKRYETILRASAGHVLETLELQPEQQRGEFVLLIDRHPASADKGLESVENAAEVLRLLKITLNYMPLKHAAKCVAEITGVTRKVAYDAGLQIKKPDG